MFEGLSVSQWCSRACARPLESITGLCIFATVAAGGAVESVASPSLAVLFITCLFYSRSWPESWRRLTQNERLMLLGFGLYALSAMLAYYNVSDEYEYVKHLGRYTRFLVIIPIYLLLSRADLKLFNYLLAGAVVSGFLYLSIALVSIADRPGLPAQGDYHHITFGDMAMLNAMFLTTVIAAMNTNKLLKIVLLISIACLLYASILSQARGAWLALPFCLSLLIYASVRNGAIKIKTVIIALVVLIAVIAVSPVKNTIEIRWEDAVHEIGLFQSGEKFDSSVGGRLAMWDVAINVWKEHPVIGSGPGDFDEDLRASQAQGLYRAIDVHSSVHNIFLQALATTGTIGFIIMCFALVILPFRFFYRTNKVKANVASLSGMVTIMAFAIFGLTESWMLRSPVIAVFLLYFVTLTTTASKETVESR